MVNFVEAPAVSRNPNPRAPLAAVLRYRADADARVSVEIDDGKNKWRVAFPSQGHEVSLPIAGLRADRIHHFRIELTDTGGAQTAAQTDYRTPPLPPAPMDFPPVQKIKAEPARMEPGITLLSVRRQSFGRDVMQTKNQARFSRAWGMILAIDAEGEVVWFYQSDRRIAGIDRLPNGNIFATHVDFTVMEIDLLGNAVRQWSPALQPGGARPGSIPIDARSMHHQPKVLPNGNFLSLNAFARELPNYYTSEFDSDAPRRTQPVVGDEIIEFTPTGEVVWRWNTFEHLDPYRIGYNTFNAYWHVRGFPHHLDWTHGNGVTMDPRDGNIIVSLRIQDAVLKIDRSSGEIIWILGTHDGWSEKYRAKLLHPIGNLRWPFHGHNPRVTPQGTIVMFDNGIFQARPFAQALPPNKTYSRGVEYLVDEKAMTATQLWASDTQLNEDSHNSWAMGDAHRLPKTDNMLVVYSICFPMEEGLTYDEWNRANLHPDDMPTWARIREYTRCEPPEVLWEVQIRDPNDVVQWQVYGGLRVASLQPEK
ncbi:MAG: aryl-sulfate sulfotransferase [Burkholderiales bacterium]